MALQMRVYKEVAGVEAKVMLGMSWRQLAATGLMLLLGGGESCLFFMVLHNTDLGSDLLVLVCLPVALWGWWRPKGLKPEAYIRYMLRQRFGQSVFLRDGRTVLRSTRRPGTNEHAKDMTGAHTENEREQDDETETQQEQDREQPSQKRFRETEEASGRPRAGNRKGADRL